MDNINRPKLEKTTFSQTPISTSAFLIEHKLLNGASVLVRIMSIGMRSII